MTTNTRKIIAAELVSFMNDSPKFVVSTTPSTVEWKNSTLISGNVAEQLRALRMRRRCGNWPSVTPLKAGLQPRPTAL